LAARTVTVPTVGGARIRGVRGGKRATATRASVTPTIPAAGNVARRSPNACGYGVIQIPSMMAGPSEENVPSVPAETGHMPLVV
jgi:hypothetical protein